MGYSLCSAANVQLRICAASDYSLCCASDYSLRSASDYRLCPASSWRLLLCSAPAAVRIQHRICRLKTSPKLDADRQCPRRLAVPPMYLCPTRQLDCSFEKKLAAE